MAARALRRRARSEIRARCVELARLIRDLPHDGETATSLIALGLELAEDLGHKPQDLIRLCQRIVEAPQVPDPRRDTWGT